MRKVGFSVKAGSQLRNEDIFFMGTHQMALYSHVDMWTRLMMTLTACGGGDILVDKEGKHVWREERVLRGWLVGPGS